MVRALQSSKNMLRSVNNLSKNYIFIGILLLIGWGLSRAMADIVANNFEHAGANAPTLLVFFEMIIIAAFGFLVYELAKPTVIPSFVLAIFLGMMERQTLAPLIGNSTILGILTTMGAAFILFGGGLDTPFARFKKLIGPILSIAFFGTLITAFLLSVFFSWMAGAAVSIGAVVLLGAALSSTDPAAIIPSLKSLVFPNPRVKDIAVSESAINDVVGAVLTGVFLTVLTAQEVMPGSIGEVYAHLGNMETLIEVIKELVIGCVVGFVGFLILHMWSKWKAKVGEGGEADAALFLAVPLLCYLLAVYFHGSGFLAVFIAGLLFQLEDHVSHVEHYFVHTIEGFMKPLIFMLLGATVDLNELISVAGLGISIGLLFMFVIRPIAVFVTLSPFMLGKHKMTVRELLFISFVRETGVIPAVLLMGLGASGIPGTETVVLVGLWVILLTLIIQPPLTPLVAKALKIAQPAGAFPKRHAKGPVAVLCSRGRSFVTRIDRVVEWCDAHHVTNIALLHSPEGKYSTKFIKEMQKMAEDLFQKINKNRNADGKKTLNFEFIGRPGALQDNIEAMVSQDDVSIVFVGSKMLDYRIADVKRLEVPFVFVA